MAERRVHRGLIVLGVFVVAVVLLIAFWSWNWFRPLVAMEASSALGRKVTIGHFDVKLGRTTTLLADDVTVANPPDFPQTPPFATIAHLAVQVNVMDYIRHRAIVIPGIDVERPVVEAAETPDGKSNWALNTGSSSPGTQSSSSPGPQIGDLRIADGHAHVVIPKLRADFALGIATNEPQTPAAQGTSAQPAAAPATAAAAGGQEGQIIVDARGTYAGQPITGRLIGGALLSLRDATKPYPVDLRLANGPTKVALAGTIQDPLKFEGANLKLQFAGPDMALLYPLTGIPIPQTPPFNIAGNLDYDHVHNTIRFQHFTGTVGKSDLNGDIAIDPGRERPIVTATLSSRNVQLADLGGFIGATPGQTSTPGQTPQQRAEVAKAEASPRLIPDTPINMPKLKAADVRLHYKGEHIEGRSVPLDNLVVYLEITDGNISLHPLDFGIGRGAISSNIDLANVGNVLHEKAKIDFRQVDLARIMAATHMFGGAGLIGGSAAIDTAGNSLAAMLGNGNGELRLYMTGGGNLSALLVDLSGFEFGNSLLSALGVPSRATIRCLISDFALNHGVLQTQVLALDTSEADVHGAGDIDLRNETLNYQIKTQATHFTIGSLPAPIDITGTLKHPSIRPDLVALGARGGIAAGLGVLFPPLALLPTIQLGLGEHNDCARLMTPPTAPAR
ncbi:MAG: AsmA family protein [Acidisphaera sp.]|nr:AsmA family protein [Acidisphaera sp.]